MSIPAFDGIDLLDARTLELLSRAWLRGDHETYRVLRDQAIACAKADQRSRELADRRLVDRFRSLAIAQGVSVEASRAMFDLSDLEPDVQDRLIRLRQRTDLATYITAVGDARSKAREQQEQR